MSKYITTEELFNNIAESWNKLVACGVKYAGIEFDEENHVNYYVLELGTSTIYHGFIVSVKRETKTMFYGVEAKESKLRLFFVEHSECLGM